MTSKSTEQKDVKELLAQEICRAMAIQEGWRNPKSKQFSNKNPGNVMDLSFFKETNKFRLAVFPTWKQGWDVMKNLAIRFLIGKKLTLEEFIGGKKPLYNGFAPLGHGANDPVLYAKNVASFLSLDPKEPCSPEWLQKIKPTIKDLPLYGVGPLGEP